MAVSCQGNYGVPLSYFPYAFEHTQQGRQGVSVTVCSVSVVISSQSIYQQNYHRSIVCIFDAVIETSLLNAYYENLCVTVWGISKAPPVSQIWCDTLEIFVAMGSCAHMNCLRLFTITWLNNHQAIATFLLVMYETSLDYWYRPTVIGLPAKELWLPITVSKSPTQYQYKLVENMGRCAIFDMCWPWQLLK